MKSIKVLAVGAALVAVQSVAMAQMPSDAKEERMDATLRKFGYVTGQAFQCHGKEQ